MLQLKDSSPRMEVLSFFWATSVGQSPPATRINKAEQKEYIVTYNLWPNQQLGNEKGRKDRGLQGWKPEI
jgi:hypothetical protein